VCYQFCRDATESRSFFAKESQGSAERSTFTGCTSGRKASAATDYVEPHVQPRKKSKQSTSTALPHQGILAAMQQG
jgi:hypothetical protein